MQAGYWPRGWSFSSAPALISHIGVQFVAYLMEKEGKKKKKDSIFSFNLITQSIVPGGKDLGAKINAQQCSVLHSFLIKNTVLIIQSEFSSSFFKSQIWGRGLAQ